MTLSERIRTRECPSAASPDGRHGPWSGSADGKSRTCALCGSPDPNPGGWRAEWVRRMDERRARVGVVAEKEVSR